MYLVLSLSSDRAQGQFGPLNPSAPPPPPPPAFPILMLAAKPWVIPRWGRFLSLGGGLPLGRIMADSSASFRSACGLPLRAALYSGSHSESQRSWLRCCPRGWKRLVFFVMKIKWPFYDNRKSTVLFASRVNTRTWGSQERYFHNM